MTEFGLALNLHLKTSGIISQHVERVLDIAIHIAGIQPGLKPTRLQIVKLNQFIRNLRIYPTHPKDCRTISFVMDGAVDKTPFEMFYKMNDRDENIFIDAYFRQKYNVRLQELPLIKTKGGKVSSLPRSPARLLSLTSFSFPHQNSRPAPFH